MRIIRGRFKTRRYKIPKNFPSRPTTDFAKEGLFNILDNQLETGNLKVLDLCFGTGNISMEFLSREWGTVTAVDKNYNCVRHLKKMVKEFDCENEIQIVKSDIISYLKKTEEKFDLIFTDPPFDFEHYPEIVSLVFERDLLNKNGELIIEHGKFTKLETITHFEKMRMYSNVCFSFFNYEQ